MNYNEGIVATGRTGAGKSTALRIVAHDILMTGAGCLWFCMKPDEADIAEGVIKDAGRGSSLIRYDPGSIIRFNPLTYEMSRHGGSAVGLAAILRDLNEVLTRSDKASDNFWEGHFVTCLIHACNVVWIALREDASLEWVYQLVSSVPETIPFPASYHKSQCKKILKAAVANAQTATEERQVLVAVDYFHEQLPSAGEKVRGAVLSQVCNTLMPFTMPPLSDTMNGESTLTPEKALNHGLCVVADYDLMTFGNHGLSFQLILSFFFMEAVLRRKNTEIPFMFVRDEYQLFTHPRRDIRAQAIARSQQFISLAGFQTLPILEDGLGGGLEAQAQARSLYSCHVNKIMLNNNCPQTNEENSKIIGMNRQMFFSGKTNHHKPAETFDWLGVGARPDVSMSQQYHYRVPPITFTSLKTGGKENNFIVEALIHNGFDYHHARFHQRS